ncbi:hypothetical protein NE237_004141 [Protea cynaroides]|uniref:Uncharacterized protein n=1 Tax=Protea cynaroides TaxID=273540 RepID=A0A9Q0KIB3_9MAGN|nr:hypothetical protein NE237_004141 [Protea cynaroides]
MRESLKGHVEENLVEQPGVVDNSGQDELVSTVRRGDQGVGINNSVTEGVLDAFVALEAELSSAVDTVRTSSGLNGASLIASSTRRVEIHFEDVIAVDDSLLHGEEFSAAGKGLLVDL